MVDITPLIAQGSHMIRGYGDGGFSVRDTRYEHSLLVYPDELLPWDVADINDITIDNFSPIIARKDKATIILLGCGDVQHFLPQAIEAALAQHNLVVEVMDTGAACRTYNALMAEERCVAAALIAV